jgi:serine O-acetyltransferase
VTVQHAPSDGFPPTKWLTWLLWLRSRRWFPPRITLELLRFIGPDIPTQVRIGRDLRIFHRGTGVVMFERVVIGDRVHLQHNVTLGRADVWEPEVPGDHPLIVVGDDVWLGVGAVVLATAAKPVTIGRGTVVGANAVLTRSTGEWEIWAGAPARRIGSREDRRPPVIDLREEQRPRSRVLG